MLLSFSGAIKDEYILARVTEVLPADKALVRRVKVKFRRKNSREAWNASKSKMEENIVAVQKLSLLVPAPRSDDDVPAVSISSPSPSDTTAASSSTPPFIAASSTSSG